MFPRSIAALPSSARKHRRGEVRSMLMAALLIRADTVTLGTADEDRAAASLCELQPSGTESRGAGNPTRFTQRSCTALSDRSLSAPSSKPGCVVTFTAISREQRGCGSDAATRPAQVSPRKQVSGFRQQPPRTSSEHSAPPAHQRTYR